MTYRGTAPSRPGDAGPALRSGTSQIRSTIRFGAVRRLGPWLETRAEQICSFDAMLMPGLMQTPEYAEAVIRNAEGARATAFSVGKWMQLRLDRQRCWNPRSG
ncbi:hypothetical protein Pen02_20530 [Plantactinospora endophytica]|uniref:DUF5753 domain-containing protein n=1 Tax=Plantactinospora endophytica TaxID=673535 RepID=A0ABQ4DXC7_9ACTN|nr:hypothetical protein Pen02_20530 [Plantactinospora endophytica]